MKRRDQPATRFGTAFFDLGSGIVLVLSASVMVFILGWVLAKLCSFDPRLQNLWPEQPVPYAAAFWLAAFTLLCFLTMTLLGKRSQRNVTMSTISLWLVASPFVSIGLAGISHLLIVPTVVIATAGLVFVWTSDNWKWLALLFPIAVGAMWLSLERVLYDGVGFQMPELMLIRVSIVTSSLLPAMKCAGQESLFRLSLAGTVATVTAFTLAIALSPAE